MDSMKEMVKQREVPHIPEDLIFDHILPRLPVKPLGQFMLVKKSWYACIKSSLFVRKHFDHSVSCNKNDASRDYLLHTWFLSKDQTNCGQLFSDGPNGYEKISDIKLPKFVGEDENSFLVVGSFNGLVCLSEDYAHRYGRRIYFWNPLIRKLRANVDSTCDDLLDKFCWVGLGFWYDSEENDHKLVRLVYSNTAEGHPYFKYCHVEVYNFSTNSWRKTGNGAVNPFINSLTGGVFLNGYLYWLATYTDDDGMQQMILCFDVKNEVFRTLDWPFDSTTLLMNYMGSLAAFIKIWSWDMRLTKGGILRVLRESDKGISWRRIFKVVTQERIKYSLGITKNGCILLLTDDLRMVEYDFHDQSFKNIAISEYDYANQMATYRESLLLLDEETDDSAELDRHVAKEDELKKGKIKDPREQANTNNS